jgi:hypothetical protein
MKGQRYMTEKTRRASQARQEREEFLRKLEEIRKGVPQEQKSRDANPRLS